MNPPICSLCHKDCSCESFHFGTGGGYVRFADFRPLPDGYVGHPQGLVWLCTQHLTVGEELAELASEEAMSNLRKRFGEFPPYSSGAQHNPDLWVTAVGPNQAKVLGIVRSAMRISPPEANSLLASGYFKVKTGWPTELNTLAEALEAAGASVVIQCP